ncbi:MAG TPA: glutaredoxin 3 [Rhizobiales bacterium]|nr:glutaredoxin 3 [Hyphomicrobiales bacterium]
MAKVVMYSTKLCPYCSAARRLLTKKGADMEIIDVTFDHAKRQAMAKKAGGRTSVPQIFIGDTHIGGCDDLFDLDQEGALEPMLAAS